MQNILIISHAHPVESTGGAEIAAYNLFKALRARVDVRAVTFLAGSAKGGHSIGTIVSLKKDEYLWKYNEMDWFHLRSGTPNSIVTHFREFLVRCSPALIFVHHYAHLGIEILQEIKKTLPQAKLILTLHEYLAICNRNGQMVKNVTKKLCYSESIRECHNCFPLISEENFWLRKHFIQRCFENVDLFISPSVFLADRYADWGVPRNYIKIIENGQERKNAASLARLIAEKKSKPRDYSNRFAYFGQATEYKGIEVFLRAILTISQSLRSNALFEIHCANLEQQGDWFKSLLTELSAPLLKEGVLRWVGAYDHHELPSRMAKIGWAVVPSTWWENSPMVIQEAFMNGVPVICSNIGGMAEKVRDGVDGIHFAVNNPIDLAEKIVSVCTQQELWHHMMDNITPRMSMDDYAEQYLSAASVSRV